MKRKLTNGHLAIILIVAILVVDQIIKIWVKTNMALYSTIEITSWFKIHFIENNGMAYGMTFVPKVFLSVFRIFAVAVLCYFIRLQVKQKARTLYIVLLSMVAAGAAGNIFDSMFYGLCFSSSSPDYVSYWVPFGSGYAPFLMGKVVDMFYFPLFTTVLPEWFPINGGQPYTFFSPVFNFADASISVGVIMLLLFCRKELSDISLSQKKEDPTQPPVEEESSQENSQP